MAKLIFDQLDRTFFTDEQWFLLQERAAIKEFDGHISRARAEWESAFELTTFGLPETEVIN